MKWLWRLFRKQKNERRVEPGEEVAPGGREASSSSGGEALENSHAQEATMNKLDLTGTILNPKQEKFGVSFTLAGEITRPDGRTRKFYERVKAFGKVADFVLANVKDGMSARVFGKISQNVVGTGEKRRSFTDLVALQVTPIEVTGEFAEADAAGQVIMKGAVNRAEIVGNLTRDPRAVGQSGAAATVAVDERFTDRNGEERKTTHFIDVTAWGGAGEALLALGKGARVSVMGPALTRSFDGKDGKRYVLEVNADFVAQVASSRPASQEAASDATESTQPVPTFDPSAAEDLPA